jgi:phosphoglycolate phosphatase
MSARRRILLFDIDGTLIRCGGAGGEALKQAFCEEFELREFQSVQLQGRTDLGILNELLELHGIAATEDNRRRICNRYFSLLPQHLNHLQRQALAHTLPGVDLLLEQLTEQMQSDAHVHWVVGILTGNMPTSAQIKLQHFQLWDYFQLGIYGDLTDHRPHLAEPALEIVSRFCGQPVQGESVVVIGDTPLDIRLARAMRARSLAVCTGGFSSEELLGEGADHVVPDLSDSRQLIEWFSHQ